MFHSKSSFFSYIRKPNSKECKKLGDIDKIEKQATFLKAVDETLREIDNKINEQNENFSAQVNEVKSVSQALKQEITQSTLTESADNQVILGDLEEELEDIYDKRSVFILCEKYLTKTISQEQFKKHLSQYKFSNELIQNISNWDNSLIRTTEDCIDAFTRQHGKLASDGFMYLKNPKR